MGRIFLSIMMFRSKNFFLIIYFLAFVKKSFASDSSLAKETSEKANNLQTWKITEDGFLENKELGQNWAYGKTKWKLLPHDEYDSKMYLAEQEGPALLPPLP